MNDLLLLLLLLKLFITDRTRSNLNASKLNTLHAAIDEWFIYCMYCKSLFSINAIAKHKSILPSDPTAALLRTPNINTNTNANTQANTNTNDSFEDRKPV